ncbi:MULTISPECIES: fumarylacetoacetate hydrolase family protein [Halocynthiibacter]|uniref:Fumarylacetoacetate hydrolase family protein n=1 Tax=Halocynthiibacter halioticoli TaxID=2986804 RepID=A0AAE3J294_9RHOB|nr:MULTISPECIES: fumarylacetoacetate hydrolase family protein [Halocynthiibacter]MCV6825351.1 fumarylacetoacetate hydrolase family protein [Halocynthiibacter halioticoli]MCW4058352.1 fumarylacetoacetate hydrolase family protein [Halocynthiibacter sp. SDUM655004]
MKLLRMGTEGSEKPCVLDADGKARDVSSVVKDFGPQTLEGVADTLKGLDLAEFPLYEGDQRIGTPISQPKNIYCVGLNYTDHAKESGLPVPEEPILFNKSASTFCGPNAPLYYADHMTKLDWEVELGIVIGKTAFGVAPEDALDYVAGVTVVNDVSERSWQIDRGGQWMKGKSFPNFCPTGPWLVTLDELEVQNLDMWLDVNGERMQTGTTSTMIFDVKTIVSYMSSFMKLEEGDLICTGTPPGVGMGMNPPKYLKVGDTVELGIENLGSQKQTVESL